MELDATTKTASVEFKLNGAVVLSPTYTAVSVSLYVCVCVCEITAYGPCQTHLGAFFMLHTPPGHPCTFTATARALIMYLGQPRPRFPTDPQYSTNLLEISWKEPIQNDPFYVQWDV